MANFSCKVCNLKAVYACSSCKNTYYCCQLHQKKDWKSHRLLCMNQDSCTEPGFASGMSPDMSNFVVDRLENEHLCVVDGVLGDRLPWIILNEVRQLYATEEAFSPGICLSSMRGDTTVRGDQIAWLTGSESTFPAIAEGIRTLNRLIARCTNRGTWKAKITGRSKVMLSCFPGQGTCYKLHIDNPCKTGHVLSAQFFLNPNYEAKRDGGLLRVRKSGRVQDIEPKLGRLVLHWSDDRVPHEVLPTLSNRFSITVWYSGHYLQQKPELEFPIQRTFKQEAVDDDETDFANTPSSSVRNRETSQNPSQNTGHFNCTELSAHELASVINRVKKYKRNSMWHFASPARSSPLVKRLARMGSRRSAFS